MVKYYTKTHSGFIRPIWWLGHMSSGLGNRCRQFGGWSSHFDDQCQGLIVIPQFDWLCDMCGCVMSPILDIYWVELGLINNYKERFSLGRYTDSLVARSLTQPFFNFPLLLCLSNVSNIAWCFALVNIFFDLSCKRFVSSKSLILICLER